MRRVGNTSPLVFLVRAGLPEMLRAGASEVVVPEPLLRELEAHGSDDSTVRAIRDMDCTSLVTGPKIAPGMETDSRQDRRGGEEADEPRPSDPAPLAESRAARTNPGQCGGPCRAIRAHLV